MFTFEVRNKTQKQKILKNETKEKSPGQKG